MMMMHVLCFLLTIVQCVLCCQRITPRLLSYTTGLMNKANKSPIWLYRDLGAGPGCVDNMLFTLDKLLSTDYQIVSVLAQDIIHVLPKLSIEFRPKLIIFPGGGDIPYQDKLKGIGCSNIREYVKQGGNYLGFCAGGYFGCNQIHFKFGQQLWSAKRELSFHDDVHCCGPIIAPYNAETKAGVRAPLIKVSHMDKMFNVYYNGGGHFYFANKQNNGDKWNVLATYCVDGDEDRNRCHVLHHLADHCHSNGNVEQLNAIVQGKFGEGNVILTGVHPEIDPLLLDTEDHDLKEIVATLKKPNNNNQRLKLLDMMLSMFDIDTHYQNVSKL
eukprot:206485_1